MGTEGKSSPARRRRRRWDWPAVAAFGIAVAGAVSFFVFAPAETTGKVLELIERAGPAAWASAIAVVGGGSALAFTGRVLPRHEDAPAGRESGEG